MKNRIKTLKVISIIYVLIGLIGVMFILSSCSVVNKIFHKEKVSRDSTSVIHERKDSVATNDNISLHKDSSKETNETIIDFGDSKIVVPYKPQGRDSGIYYYPSNPNDYFSFDTKTGVIKSSRVPEKVTIKGSSQIENYDSLVDHSKISVSEVKNNETKVSEKKKTVTQEVHKKSFLNGWWISILAFLLTLLIIYRYRAKIKAWIMLILPI